MFYGGRLLNHFELLSHDADSDLISLLNINRNAAVVMDSDRRKGSSTRRPRMKINRTKCRIKREIEVLNGFVWVTEGKEIENYLSDEVLRRVTDTPNLVAPSLYESVPECAALQAYRKDKISLAHDAAQHTELSDLARLDLHDRVKELVKYIKRWNNLG
jgi:putative ATP-dependent endonuclease of the OLD family